MRAYRAHCSEVCARAKLCASTLPLDLSFGVMREYASERLESPVRCCVRTYLLARVCCCMCCSYVIGREFVGTSESPLISRRTQDLFACGTITTVFVVCTSSEHSTLAVQQYLRDDCNHYLRCRRQSLAQLPACYSSLGTTKRKMEELS